MPYRVATLVKVDPTIPKICCGAPNSFFVLVKTVENQSHN